MGKVAVVYHSGYGHTAAIAKAVARGAAIDGVEAKLISVTDIDKHWDELKDADAIIFGTPTYMGGVSAPFKTFMDASSKVWGEQVWKDKIAAGFTHSASQGGDKFNTLTHLFTFAMQHGMIWTGTGMMPSNTKAATRNDLNFVGGFSGLLTQSPADASPDEAPPPGDLETARAFGARIATVTARWIAA